MRKFLKSPDASCLDSKLTQVTNEALNVDEELHIRDEEAVDFSHVGDVLHE